MRFLSSLKNTKNDKGATIVLVAILLVVIIGVAALAIDVGNLVATKGELQKIADGAALAGAGDLGEQYRTKGCDAISVSDIANIANDVAVQNVADTKNITLNSSDIVWGCWDDSQTFREFGETGCSCSSSLPPNAVKVTARRDSAANTPVDTFFAGVLGPETVGLSATSVAALSGPSEASDLPIPVGISSAWFDPAKWTAEGKEFCDQPLKFYPTGTLDGCAGWHQYGSGTDSPEGCTNCWPDYVGLPANAAKLSNLLECLAGPDDCPPGGTTGDLYAYTGGTVASAFDEMKALFDAKKEVDPDYSEFPDGVWKVGLPVYESDDCSNPHGETSTAGFTTAIITEVLETPDKTINAIVVCDEIIQGHGGGGYFGTLGTIPGLVQ
jgi:Flp pilus assembly protein TadG